MNKNGDSATMYGTIPAVAGLNKVEGFDPSSLLSRTVSPATGEEGLQLGLAYKKLWFRLAYPEGRLQTEKVSLTEQVAVFEARVYLHHGDAAPVSSFVSGCAREDAAGSHYIQAAQDQAIDAALTDAGFGLQFADLCTDSSMAGDGGKPVHPGAGGAVTEKNPARNAGSAGAVVSAGNTIHTGTVVRPFPGASADGGTKKAPMPGTQPFSARQPVQAATMPQGQVAPAGIGQPVRTAAMPQNQGRQPTGTGQSVQAAAMPQSQGRQPAGTGQPVQAAAMPQSQGRQPVGTGQPIQKAAMPQNQGRQPVGTGQSVQKAAMPQNQGRQPAGARQPVQAAAIPQGQAASPTGARQPAQETAIPLGQVSPPAGTRQPAQTAMPQAQRAAVPQGQEMPPDGNGLPAQGVMRTDQGVPPAGNKLPVSPAMPQEQEMPPDGSGLPVQAVMPQGQGAQAAGKEQPATSAVPRSQGMQPERNGNPTQQAPMPSPENKAAVQAATDLAASSADSLPVPPAGKGGQTGAEPAAAADALPVPADSPGKDKSRSGVLEAIAMLNGQTLPAGTSEDTVGESRDSIVGTATGNAAAVPTEAASPGGNLPVNGETAQDGPATRYTPDMPVEEIVSLMTLEEAGRVVVDTGVSKGQTIAEVAERRPPSLKFYRYGGYKGPNNILRAAAQVMLDSIEGEKAG